MISQQTKCKCVRDWESVFPPQFHEIRVIPLLRKDVLVVVAAIEDVIIKSVFQWNGVGGHGRILPDRLET